MEVDEHTLLSLQREVKRLRAEMDQLRAVSALRSENGTGEDSGGGSNSGDEDYQQPHDVSLVPPVEADGASIDERENGDDEDDDTAGNLQIKGFAGKNKIDATNLQLTEYPSSDEFLCRTSSGELKYRKLTAGGGGSPVSTVDIEVVVGAKYDTYTHKFTLQKKKLTVLSEQSASDTEVFEATSHADEHGGTL